MKTILCISIRFIQPSPLFHGSRDAGEAEWPPSPLRVFQALVNAACLHVRGKPLAPDVRKALCTLELVRPTVVAPAATLSTVGYRAYVPHNQADLVSAAWHRGNNKATIASHRIEKDYRPLRIQHVNDSLPTLTYLYPIDDSTVDSQQLLDAIRPSVRLIHALGWGIDQVIADATLIDDVWASNVIGHRYSPTLFGGTPLRAPREGSLEALRDRHHKFLNRLIAGNWTPVPPLTAFDVVPYRREDEPNCRPHVVFKLLDDNEDPARYPHAKLVHVAAMVRHLAIETMKRNPPPWIAESERAEFVNRVIRGKRDPDAGGDHKQISYVPLPSIGHEHADAIIRNVMLIAPFGVERELAYLAERIDGEQITAETKLDHAELDATLMNAYRAEIRMFQPTNNRFIATRYLGVSRIWKSVTPIVLDGHNDRRPEKTIKLVQAALQRAGIETPCEFTWQSYPYLKNCLSAHKYDRDGRHTGYHRPKYLKDRTAVHVRITFDNPVAGPLSIGAGRHCGLGLMATATDCGAA